MKFGLSAPSYIDAAKVFPLRLTEGKESPSMYTFPMISCLYRSRQFRCMPLIMVTNRFNGNVVDLMVTPVFKKTTLINS